MSTPNEAGSLQELARNHITLDSKGTGGNVKCTCRHCNKTFTGSLTRQLAHISGETGHGIAVCQLIDEDERTSINLQIERLNRANTGSQASSSKRSAEASNIEVPAGQPAGKRLRQPTMVEMITDRKSIDMRVAECFYATGIPIHIVRSRWFTEMCKAISKSHVEYTGPAYNAMRTTLLDAVKTRVTDSCAPWLAHAKLVTGVVVVSDGWTDPQNRPLINFLLCTPKGQKYVRTVDTSGQEKSGEFIAEQLTSVINEVGPENVGAVIMDGASNNVSANRIIEDRFPHIFTLHCTAHALDLCLEKIGGMPYFRIQVSEARKVVRILTNHHALSSLFKTHSTLFLLKPGDTRFYTHYIAVRRLLRCKAGVQQTIVDTVFNLWAATSKENKDKAAYLKKMVNDEGFWTTLARFCMLLKPLVRLMRLVDSNMPSMGKVYAECCEMEKHIQKAVLPDDVKSEVAELFRERWDKMHSPLHSLGYMLEPQFQGTSFGKEVRTDFRKALKKLLPDSSEYVAAMADYTKFSNSEGVFGDADIMSLTKEDNPNMIPTYQFWVDHGYETPTLAKVAQRVTAMVSSAGACERNWSSYDFIHSKKRNKLTPGRANDLVYVFTNMRLAAKFGQPEKFAEWVTEVDEDEQKAILAEAQEVHVHADPAEMLEMAQGVAQDEELVGSEAESD